MHDDINMHTQHAHHDNAASRPADDETNSAVADTATAAPSAAPPSSRPRRPKRVRMLLVEKVREGIRVHARGGIEGDMGSTSGR